MGELPTPIRSTAILGRPYSGVNAHRREREGVIFFSLNSEKESRTEAVPEKQPQAVGEGHVATDNTSTPANTSAPTARASLASRFGGRDALLLFLASFLALYFELVVIRYLSSEVRVFAYLKNLPLVAAFLGIGLGMVLGRVPKPLQRWFGVLATALFSLIAYASLLKLTHIRFPGSDHFVWGRIGVRTALSVTSLLLYCLPILLFLALAVAFFVVLGGLVGERLSLLPALTGYGINLAGSLVGIAAFTALSYLGAPPSVWLLIGFGLMLPFLHRDKLALVLLPLLILATAIPQPDTYWSPYYRISVRRLPSPPGWPEPSAYSLTVNHDYHQKMLNLSPQFLARYPEAEPNRTAHLTYELPFRLVADPGEVLIVGAGTGNDVAAALRHGATHIDAVEIDPVILRLGQQLHPERPYDSSRVTVYVDDARAFFKKTRKKYDLIVFGYLDSHTLLTSFSSLRLDNYVYTLESFREATSLLKADGTLVVSFASGMTFVTERLFATLARAFAAPPQVYYTGYDGAGVVFVEGAARQTTARVGFPSVTNPLLSGTGETLLATDWWPFLYLEGRRIPVSLLAILLPFLLGSLVLIRRSVSLASLRDPESHHFFLLGAGFLLLETKGVTELSLLFGSTWIVNAVVIGAFLAMAFLANLLIQSRPVPRPASYVGLFLLLGAGFLFPYTLFAALPTVGKVVAAGAFAGLPVFFSGLIFSRSFRDVARPAEALGINLFGAVVGGTLENSVMVGGTPILGFLAILLYALSATCVKGWSR